VHRSAGVTETGHCCLQRHGPEGHHQYPCNEFGEMFHRQLILSALPN
jgi:hypothetical protein